MISPIDQVIVDELKKFLKKYILNIYKYSLSFTLATCKYKYKEK